jgi:hypothetical protein
VTAEEEVRLAASAMVPALWQVPQTVQAVRELTAGEVAVALFVSDWPYLRRRVSVFEVEYYAGQGLVRVGPQIVWRAAQRARAGRDLAAVFPGRTLGTPRCWQASAEAVRRYVRERPGGAGCPAALAARDRECEQRWGPPGENLAVIGAQDAVSGAGSLR